MKKLIALFLLTVSLSAAITDYNIPTPMKIVTPILTNENIGKTIVVSFVVKADGKIENININGAINDQTIDAVSTALKKWEFIPKISNGKAVDATTEIKFLVEKNNIKFL